MSRSKNREAKRLKRGIANQLTDLEMLPSPSNTMPADASPINETSLLPEGYPVGTITPSQSSTSGPPSLPYPPLSNSGYTRGASATGWGATHENEVPYGNRFSSPRHSQQTVQMGHEMSYRYPNAGHYDARFTHDPLLLATTLLASKPTPNSYRSPYSLSSAAVLAETSPSKRRDTNGEKVIRNRISEKRNRGGPSNSHGLNP